MSEPPPLNRTVAALYWPGYVESGTPDVSAYMAETREWRTFHWFGLAGRMCDVPQENYDHLMFGTLNRRRP